MTHTSAMFSLFSLKGGLFTLTSIQLLSSDLDDLSNQLEDKIKQAPNFFQHAPVVLDVHKLTIEQQSVLDLNKLSLMLKRLHLVPVGVQGAKSELQKIAILEGFALIAESRQEKLKIQETPELAIKPVIGSPTKIITQPIRSGQQVYAPGGDLLVLASVSPGAELLADGHIHVMGALRGRALAGINGDQQAMIFCKSLEAELISIAGQYQISEDLKDSLWKQPARIELLKGRLNIIDF